MSFFCPVFWQSLILIYFWVKLIFNICSLFLIFAYYDSQVSLENLLLDTIVSPWWAFGVQIINCVQQIGNDLYICASCCWPSYYQYFFQSWYDLWSTNKPMLDLWLCKLTNVIFEIKLTFYLSWIRIKNSLTWLMVALTTSDAYSSDIIMQSDQYIFYFLYISLMHYLFSFSLLLMCSICHINEIIKGLKVAMDRLEQVSLLRLVFS